MIPSHFKLYQYKASDVRTSAQADELIDYWLAGFLVLDIERVH